MSDPNRQMLPRRPWRRFLPLWQRKPTFRPRHTPTRAQRPPLDPRNVWRVQAANGWTREVASEGNARLKAAGFDEVCPAFECPHTVQRWTGTEWVDA